MKHFVWNPRGRFAKCLLCGEKFTSGEKAGDHIQEEHIEEDTSVQTNVMRYCQTLEEALK